MRARKGDLQAQGEYLEGLPVCDILKILPNGLPPDLLQHAVHASVYRCLVNRPSCRWGADFLSTLMQTPRFSINKMSVPRAKRAEICALWDAAQAGDVSGRLKDVRGAYKW